MDQAQAAETPEQIKAAKAALMRWQAAHRDDPTTLRYTTSLVNMPEKPGGVKRVNLLNGVGLVFCRRELIGSAFFPCSGSR